LTASYFTPAAVVTAPATIIGAAAGAATYGIGHATDNENLKKIGESTLSITCSAGLDDPTGRVQNSANKIFECCDRKK
jgi:hypothetical protein